MEIDVQWIDILSMLTYADRTSLYAGRRRSYADRKIPYADRKRPSSSLSGSRDGDVFA